MIAGLHSRGTLDIARKRAGLCRRGSRPMCSGVVLVGGSPRSAGWLGGAAPCRPGMIGQAGAHRHRSDGKVVGAGPGHAGRGADRVAATRCCSNVTPLLRGARDHGAGIVAKA